MTKKKGLLSAAAIALAILCLAFTDTLLAPPLPNAVVWAKVSVVETPSMARPGYLETVIDPTTGVRFSRVTNPGEPNERFGFCEGTLCRHRYSSTEAWNADQSLLVITNGCHGMCFLDGRTYVPLFHRPVGDDCKWHPVNPEVMICVRANGVFRWLPRANAWGLLYAPVAYTRLTFGPYKGNLSWDGNRIVLGARSRSGRAVAFAYDFKTNTKYADIDVDALPGKNGFCGASASGRYIACFQTTEEGTDTAYIFTPEGRQTQHWAEHHRPGHGDMTIDADGRDVYIGISKSDPDKWHVIKRRLDDGKVTDLAPAGDATHASTRNIKRPGWVFLSYEGARDRVGKDDGWAPFYREVIALKIDGSGEFVPIVQTHNAKNNYDSETHASPSPDGSQVIWTSNWGKAGDPIASYVARVPRLSKR